MGKQVMLALLLGVWTIVPELVAEARAGSNLDYRYHRVPLDAAVPPGFALFDPVAITDSERVYGNAYACGPDGCLPSVAVYHNGAVTILHAGIAATANESGTVGGWVVTDPDPDHLRTQAALFRGHAVELIPRLPGEVTSRVLRLTDSGIALVHTDTGPVASHYLYRSGRVTPLNLSPDPVLFFDVNNRGLVSGARYVTASGHYRGFRFQPPSGPTTLLEPLPTELDAWGLAINARSDVLGYSFNFISGPERIGVWRNSRFHTYFVEGTPQFPTISNDLLWNARGLIVITDTTDLNSYLVPGPGVRLNLADLADSLPPWTFILGVNNDGDLIGLGGPSRFDVS